MTCRRALAAAATATVFLVSACTEPAPGPSTQITASPSGTPSPTPPPIDPAVTAQVCTDATDATADASAVVNDRLAALELAAASGDQVTMVSAAEAINRQFTDLAAGLDELSRAPADPSIKTVLTEVSTALTEMASPGYTGTMVDIKKKLIDFALAFGKACGTAG